MPRREIDVKGQVSKRSMDSDTPPVLYRIGELAAMFGVTPRTIRYYEELGLLEPSDREEGAHRKYDEKNVIYLKRIQQLKDYGLALADIAELFALARRDRSGEEIRAKLAEKYREKRAEAERRRDALNAYIEDLSWHIEQLERVTDFFQCPGASCGTCAYAERCDVRLLLARG